MAAKKPRRKHTKVPPKKPRRTAARDSHRGAPIGRDEPSLPPDSEPKDIRLWPPPGMPPRPASRPGRNAFIDDNDSNVNLFLGAIMRGMTIGDAAIIAETDRSTVYRLYRRGRAAQRDKRARLPKREEAFRLFYHAVRRALTAGKAALIRRVFADANNDGRFALLVLERRYPDEWGREQIVPDELPTQEAPRWTVRRETKKPPEAPASE